MNLNKAFILGRLTADPESRSLPSGQAVSNFSLATNRVWKDKEGNRQESGDFHNIVLFGRLAEVANQYLGKGKTCLVIGRIQTRSWDGKDEQKRYRTEIVGEEIQLGPKNESSGGGEGNSYNSKSSPAKTAPQKKIEAEDEGEVDVEDIPF